MIKRFFIYGFLGWGLEIIWTGLASLIRGDMGLHAFTNLWMFPIYGLAVFLEPLHDIMAGWKWFVRGILWVVIIWGMEYSSGLLIKSFIGIYPWFYRSPFSVDGLIRLDYAPAWFCAGIIFERVHKRLDRLFV